MPNWVIFVPFFAVTFLINAVVLCTLMRARVRATQESSIRRSGLLHRVTIVPQQTD